MHPMDVAAAYSYTNDQVTSLRSELEELIKRPGAVMPTGEHQNELWLVAINVGHALSGR
jgi:hypothetical protein